MPISQLFILTPRGDAVVSKDFRGDCPRGTADIFFRKLMAWPGGHNEAPPVFSISNIHFVHIRRNNLYFVCTTKFNTSPALSIELLTRLSALCKDYCGVLTEESIRLNFVLIYEILDEAIDFGYGQTTTTEHLKSYVYNEPIAVEGGERDMKGFRRLSSSSDMSSGKERKQKKTASASKRDKPISLRFGGKGGNHKNEIFVDLLERLTVLFDAKGNVQRMEIDGCIQMKSFLQGLPELRVGLNQDLNIGRVSGAVSYGVTVDDCNFHESVQLDEFQGDRTLEGGGIGRVDVIVRLDCEFPSDATGTTCKVKVPLPKFTTSCAYELGASGQTLKYDKDDKVATWDLTKVSGGLSYYCKLKLMIPEDQARNVSSEVGAVSLDFEVPMYSTSGMNIRYLRVTERGKNFVPFRWVRYITHSDSYVFRRT
eukprot:gene3907-22990_t